MSENLSRSSSMSTCFHAEGCANGQDEMFSSGKSQHDRGMFVSQSQSTGAVQRISRFASGFEM